MRMSVKTKNGSFLKEPTGLLVNFDEGFLRSDAYEPLEDRADEKGISDGSLGVCAPQDGVMPFLAELGSLCASAFAGVTRLRNIEAAKVDAELRSLEARLSSVGTIRGAPRGGRVTQEVSDETSRSRADQLATQIALLKAKLAGIDSVFSAQVLEIQEHFAALASRYQGGYFKARTTIDQKKKELLRHKRWFGGWPLFWRKPDGIASFVGEELSQPLPLLEYRKPPLPVWAQNPKV